MQYIYGIHAVDSLVRSNPRSVQRLWVQQGRDDKRIRALVELAQNQGVPVAREPKRDLDDMVQGRHQGVVQGVAAAALCFSRSSCACVSARSDLTLRSSFIVLSCSSCSCVDPTLANFRPIMSKIATDINAGKKIYAEIRLNILQIFAKKPRYSSRSGSKISLLESLIENTPFLFKFRLVDLTSGEPFF